MGLSAELLEQWGLPGDPSIGELRSKGLGSLLVSMLVRQIEGTMSVESSGGTSIRIGFRASEASLAL